jgi:hypothetical protein
MIGRNAELVPDITAARSAGNGVPMALSSIYPKRVLQRTLWLSS